MHFQVLFLCQTEINQSSDSWLIIVFRVLTFLSCPEDALELNILNISVMYGSFHAETRELSEFVGPF